MENLLESGVLVTDPLLFFSLLERKLRMKRFFGLLLALTLVVGCSDGTDSGPSSAPQSGSSTAGAANLQTVVFNVPGMT